ncbi:MAG: hypothetical protein Kapaf2KO_17810 [Candidatus Kapaibacteriales bacterium]
MHYNNIRHTLQISFTILILIVGIKLYDGYLVNKYIQDDFNEAKKAGVLKDYQEYHRKEDNFESIGYKSLATHISNLDKNIVIASGEHGYIAALNLQMKIIDYTGLHNQNIALGKDFIGVVESQKPDLIHLPHLNMIGLYKEFLNYYSENKDFTYLRLKWFFGVAVRKESHYHDDLVRFVDSTDKLLYKSKRLTE